MDVEVSPEPTPAERQALLAAIARLLDEELRSDEHGAWWEAGVRESVEGSGDGQACSAT